MSVDIFPFALWQSGTNENSIPANDNALRSEVLAKGALGVADEDPVDPVSGDLYIVGDPWGDFGTDDVAIFISGVWLGFTPFVGWAKTIGSEFYFYEGGSSGWVEVQGGGGGGSVESVVAGTGISVDNADPANPIVSATAVPGGWDNVVTLDSTAGEVTIDLAMPSGFVVTLDEDVTDLIFDSVPSAKYVVFAITFVQDGTGGWEITWPAAVQGTPAQPNPAASSVTIMSFATWDGGTTIYQAD